MPKPSLYADIWHHKTISNSLEWECVRIYVRMCKVTWWCIPVGEQVYLLDLFAGSRLVGVGFSIEPSPWQPSSRGLSNRQKMLPTSWREASKSALAIKHCLWNCLLDHILLEKLFSFLCKQRMQKWHDITIENKTCTQQYTKIMRALFFSPATRFLLVKAHILQVQKHTIFHSSLQNSLREGDVGVSAENQWLASRWHSFNMCQLVQCEVQSHQGRRGGSPIEMACEARANSLKAS